MISTEFIDFPKVVESAIKKEIERVCEEEAIKAAERIRERVPEIAARIAINTEHYYSITRQAGELLITIRGIK